MISSKDRDSWKKHEGFELFKKAIKEYNQKLYDQIDRETSWRSNLDIKDLAKKFESWLIVERRTTERKKDIFCNMISEFKKMQMELDLRRYPTFFDDISSDEESVNDESVNDESEASDTDEEESS